MLLNEDFKSGSGSQYSGEQKIGGAPPSGGASGYFSGGGPQSRFMTHEEARSQILNMQPQGAQQGAQGPSVGYRNLGSIDQPLGRQGAQIGQQISGAVKDFGEKVGGPSGYDEQALQQAINPGSTEGQRAQGTKSAREQLDSTYKGPEMIDPTQIAQIAQTIGDYGQRARSLQTGGGLAGEVQRRTPGTRSGEALFEAEQIQRDNPNYRDAFQDDIQQAAAYNAQLSREQARAQELVNLRKEQEKQVAQQARTYLGGQKSAVYDRLQAEADALNQKNAEAARLYDQAVANPNAQNLGALDPYTDANLAGFEEPRALNQQAKAAYADVMMRYAQAFPEIAAYPPLQKIVTGRGETWYGIPGPDGQVTDIRKIPGMSKETERHLRARQRELEALFEPQGPKSKAKTPEGQYANVMPLYYGEGGADPMQNVYQPPDPKDYLSLNAGNTATREILASSDDRTLVDNVNALLDESDRLMETGDVFQAATIAADVEKYLDDVETQMREREGTLDEADRKFVLAQRKARNRYKKAKAKKLGRDIGTIVGGVLTYQLGGPWGPVGKYVGGPLGAEIGEGVA